MFLANGGLRRPVFDQPLHHSSALRAARGRGRDFQGLKVPGKNRAPSGRCGRVT